MPKNRVMKRSSSRALVLSSNKLTRQNGVLNFVRFLEKRIQNGHLFNLLQNGLLLDELYHLRVNDEVFESAKHSGLIKKDAREWNERAMQDVVFSLTNFCVVACIFEMDQGSLVRFADLMDRTYALSLESINALLKHYWQNERSKPKSAHHGLSLNTLIPLIVHLGIVGQDEVGSLF